MSAPKLFCFCFCFTKLVSWIRLWSGFVDFTFYLVALQLHKALVLFCGPCVGIGKQMTFHIKLLTEILVQVACLTQFRDVSETANFLCPVLNKWSCLSFLLCLLLLRCLLAAGESPSQSTLLSNTVYPTSDISLSTQDGWGRQCLSGNAMES